MIELISIILIALLFILSMKRFAYGFSLFLCVRILVPETVRFMGTELSLNTVMIFILFIMLLVMSALQNKKLYINKKFLLAVFSFLTYCIISLVLSDYLNLSEQINYLFQFFITDIVPVILCISIVRDKKDISLVIKWFLISCIVVGGYGILSYFLGSNPYLMFWDSVAYYLKGDYWFGNFTSSTFVSSNAFGYFLGITIPFLTFLVKKGLYKNYAKTAIVLLIPCIFLCKKRTTIIVFVIFLLLVFWFSNIQNKKKYIMLGSPILVLGVVLIFSLPSLESVKNMLITSLLFWDDNVYNKMTLDNGGSNMLLRLRQLVYPFIEIKSNYLFGHGFGWTSAYLAKDGIHPVLYGFETLPSQLICEYGIMAFFVFPIVICKYFNFVNTNRQDKFIKIFLIVSIVQMIGTGAVYWYLVLVLMLLMKLINEQYTHKGE